MRLLLLLLAILPCSIFGQLQSWSGLSFEHEVSPSWAYVVEAEHRRPIARGEKANFLFLLAGNRLLARNTSLTFGSRYQPANPGEDPILRGFADLNYKLPLGGGPFTLESRLRYQQDRPLDRDGSFRRVSVRPRLGLSADLGSKISCVVEMEGRFRLDSRDEWSRVRQTYGIGYTLSDRLALDIFFRREKRINQANPSIENIIGLYADYTLPDGRDREWKYRKPFGRRLIW